MFKGDNMKLKENKITKGAALGSWMHKENSTKH